MKIVDRQTFLTLSEGTVYSDYEPCIFGPLAIKGVTIGRDFYVQEIADAIGCASSEEFSDILIAAQADGRSVPMDFDCEGRDGIFDDSQLYAVWEPHDVKRLIARLIACEEPPRKGE